MLAAPILAFLLMRRPTPGKKSISDRIVRTLQRPYRPLVEFFVGHR
jgi:Cu/Ag efflux pump CusA